MSRPTLASIRKFAVCAAVFTFSSFASSQSPKDLALKTEKLAEGIYLFRAPSDLDLWTATNVVAIINDHDVTVFDSNSRASTARMVIAEIRKITPLPVRTLINSHWHLDHWTGNDEYVKAFPGLQVISTVATRDYMKRMGPGYFAAGIDRDLPNARAILAAAIQSGKRKDGTPLSAEARHAMEQDIEDTARFADEMRSVPRVLPDLVFRDSLTFWRGKREFRLIEATGDATGSAVLYLPAEKILVTGDVLVRPEEGDGPPPWTTNSYSITPWLESLRALEALDADIIVPGQGESLHGKAYLKTTADLYAAIIAQVHAALERGLFKPEDVQAAVNVDSFSPLYSPDTKAPTPAFKSLVKRLVAKVYLESLDGAGR